MKTQLFNPYLLESSLSANEAVDYAHDTHIQAVNEAFLKAIPFYMHFQKRYEYVMGYQMMMGADRNPFGNFLLLRQPVTASTQRDVMPNTDTLYGVTFLDLSVQGATVITVPSIPNRFWSLQFVDNEFYNYDYISRRTDGDGNGRYLLVPPGWQGSVPSGITRVLHAPSTSTQIYQRVYFSDTADLPAVYAIQKGIFTQSEGGSVDVTTVVSKKPNATSAREFFAKAADYSGVHDEMAQYDDVTLEKGVALARFHMAQYIADEAKADREWQALAMNVGRRGKVSVVSHAVTQIRSMAANDVQEAIYFLGKTDARQQALRGEQTYTLHFSKEQVPPVHEGGFWSITLYDAHTFMLVENEIHRYAIRSKDQLTKDAQGGITLYLQKDVPDEADKIPNWLPTAGHDFILMLRLYVPAEAVLKGAYIPPGVE